MEPEKKEEIVKVEEEKKEVEKAEEKPEEMTEQEDLSIEEKAKKEGCLIDPYNVVNTTGKEIDYTKVVKNFGLQMVTQQQIDRMEKLTGVRTHHLIRRGIFFAERDLNVILDAYEKHPKDSKTPPFYLYTGRGPSSEALHLGHILPFTFTKYLQEAFNVPLVIQVTDDEKFFFKEGEDITSFNKLAYQNIKDILALGFDPEKTFIFIDTEYIGHMYLNVVRFQRYINLTTLKAIFGLKFEDNSGKAAYPAIQAAPCLSSSFPHIFGNKNIPCIIPCGIDQDPYFRMTRDVCAKLGAPKPASFYSKFFPSLQGFQTKMTSHEPNTGIFMTDTPKEIAKKINSHAFSGGGKTKEEQEKYGANLEVDIPYHYLRFFLQDDKRLQEIREGYGSGKMLSGEVKKQLIGILQKFVADHQEKRKQIKMEDIKKFTEIRKMK